MVVERIRRKIIGTKVHELMDAHPEFKEHGRRSLETLSAVKTIMEKGIVPNDVTADYGSDWATSRKHYGLSKGESGLIPYSSTSRKQTRWRRS